MPFIGNTPQVQSFAPAVDYFSGNGVTVTFTLSRPVVSVAQMVVVIDNVPQNPSSAYTVSGSSITFTSAPLAGTNNIWIEYTSLITTYAAISQDPSVVGSLTASGGYLANGNYGNSFVDGTIVDYVTGNARITTGAADGLTIYNGGPSARNALLSIDSSGNVGIGTGTGASTPTSPLTLYANRYDTLRIGRYAPASFAIGIPTGSATDALQFYGYQAGYDGYLFTGVSGDKLYLNTNGNVVLKGGTATASGVGITFPASQSASTDPNCLDDYEEGTWTPTKGAGMTTTGTFTSSGSYVKAGQMVCIQGQCSASSIAITTSGIFVSGLPFQITNNGGGLSIGGYSNQSNTLLRLHYVGATNLYNIGGASSGDTQIYFAATYQTIT